MNSTLKALVVAVILAGVGVGGFFFLTKNGPDTSTQSTRTSTDSVEAPSAKIEAKPRLDLPDPEKIACSGSVKDEAGNPLPGATVIALRKSGGELPNKEIERLKSNNSGEFTFNLRAGEYVFVGRLSGFQDSRVTRALVKGVQTEPVSLVLRSGLAISGYVRDFSNKPIAGATVGAFRERSPKKATEIERLMALAESQKVENDPGVLATSGEDGYNQIVGLETHEYRLRVSAPKYSPSVRRYVEAGSEEVNFNLEVGGQIVGFVSDEQTGNPIADAFVEVFEDSDPGSTDIFEEVVKRTLPPIATAYSGPGGRYEVDGLGGSSYVVIVSAPGYQAAEINQVIVDTGLRPQQDFQLKKGNVIEGIVYTPSGEPLEGATVKVNLQGATERSFRGGLIDPGKPTEAGGEFVFNSLQEGRYRLVVSHEDFATHIDQRIEPNGGRLEIQLTDGGAISGRVFSEQNGEAISGATVMVRDVAEDKRGVTDANGEFTVRGIAPGRREQRLSVEAEGFAPNRELKATVVEGEVTSGIEVPLMRCGRVSGVVLHPETGAPVPGVTITVKRSSSPEMPVAVIVGKAVKSDANGQFLLNDVHPGKNTRVTGTHPAFLDSASDSFDVAQGQSIENVQLTLFLGGQIGGRVVDDAGAPVADAVVAVRDNRLGNIDPVSMSKKVRTDEKGEFLIDNVEPSEEVTLVADKQGFLRTEVGGVLVQSARLTPNVEIVLTQGAFLSGFVTDSNGDPINGATITCIDTSDGLRKPTQKTNSEGYYLFDNLGPYPVDMIVEAPNYSKMRRYEQPVNQEQVSFTLSRLGSISGTVVDQNGSPLRAFSVSPRILVEGQDKQKVPTKTFNKRQDGQFRFSGLEQGSYNVTIGCPGYSVETINVGVFEDRDTDLGRIVLNEGGKVGGYVVDAETREPVVGANITLVGNPRLMENPFSGVGRQQPRRGRNLRRRTDRQGYFLVEGLVDNRVTLQIDHRSYKRTVVELQVGETEREVLMSLGGVINGQLRIPPGADTHGMQLLISGNGHSDRTSVDRKGNFTFTGLDDGVYTIRMSPFGRRVPQDGTGTYDFANTTKVVQVIDGNAPFTVVNLVYVPGKAERRKGAADDPDSGGAKDDGGGGRGGGRGGR